MFTNLIHFVEKTFSNTPFINPIYLLDDLFFITNICLALSILIFFYNFSNPFALILLLEIMYLMININFITSWVYMQFFNGLSYVLLIIGISGAETIVGLVIIVKLYSTQYEFVTQPLAK